MTFQFRYPVVSTEPFKQLAQLATHLEKLKPLMRPTLATLLKEDVLNSLGDRDEYEMIKLEEDSLLCGFNPWFRGLDWKLYRRYAPKSVPSTLAQVGFYSVYSAGLNNEHLKNKLLQWGLEYQTSLVFGCSIFVWLSPNHSKSGHSKCPL